MKNILLIDDNAETRENFAEILEIDGYKVTVAPNGQQALCIMAGARPDLIVCDIQMPGMDGFELKQKLDALQEQNGNTKIPFIFLSACSAPQDIEQAKKLGAKAYLLKPVEINTVIETIKKAFIVNFQSG